MSSRQSFMSEPKPSLPDEKQQVPKPSFWSQCRDFAANAFSYRPDSAHSESEQEYQRQWDLHILASTQFPEAATHAFSVGRNGLAEHLRPPVGPEKAHAESSAEVEKSPRQEKGKGDEGNEEENGDVEKAKGNQILLDYMRSRREREAERIEWRWIWGVKQYPEAATHAAGLAIGLFAEHLRPPEQPGETGEKSVAAEEKSMGESTEKVEEKRNKGSEKGEHAEYQ
nr:hypothetical protein B0A51_07762 [Rachicladosporium sp. CCFEE 5018]